jgi:hypothetical protein
MDYIINKNEFVILTKYKNKKIIFTLLKKWLYIKKCITVEISLLKK